MRYLSQWLLVVAASRVLIGAPVIVQGSSTKLDTPQGYDAPPGPEQELQFTVFLEKLKMRDQALEGLFLPFYSVDRTKEGIKGTQLGWWLYARGGFAAFVMTENERGRQIEHDTWNGASYSSFRAKVPSAIKSLDESDYGLVEPPSKEGLTYQTMTIQSGLPQKGTLYAVSTAPSSLGLMIKHKSWPQFFQTVKDVRPIGRRVVDGRDCLLVLFDRQLGENNEQYTSPYFVCFDDRDSLLAIKVESLQKASTLGQRKDFLAPPEEEAAKIGGEEWFVYKRWKLTETCKMPNGVTLPAKGEVTHPHCGQVANTSVSIACGRAKFLQNPPRELMDPIPPRATDVNNEITGERYTVAAERAPIENNKDLEWPSDSRAGYIRTIEEYAYLVRQPLGLNLSPQLSSLELSCGPMVVSVLADMFGKGTDLSSWIGVDTTSLSELANIAKKCGLTATPVHASPADLDGLHLPCIVHLEGDEQLGHFALAAVEGEVVHIYSPPTCPVRMNRSEFGATFSGAALVVGNSPESLAGILVAARTPSWRPWVLVASVMLLVFATLKLALRHRSALNY